MSRHSPAGRSIVELGWNLTGCNANCFAARPRILSLDYRRGSDQVYDWQPSDKTSEILPLLGRIALLELRLCHIHWQSFAAPGRDSLPRRARWFVWSDRKSD